MIKGITVSLKKKTQTGVDGFNQPVYSEDWIQVDNVLPGEPTGEEIVNDLQAYGKRLAYALGIPKGDENSWLDTEVKFFDQTFKTYGPVVQGVEANVPGVWHKKVKVEKYG